MTRPWIEDLRELFIFDIWPCPDDTYIEKVNTISRFVIMASSILAVHRKSIRLFIAGVLLSVAIALRAPPCEQNDKEIIDEPQSKSIEEPIIEDPPDVGYVDNVDSFAHFLYGDINRNNKQK